MKELFLKQGYAKLDRLIPNSEVENLRGLYDDLLQDKERTLGLRSDLGGGEGGTVEKITQIMRPSMVEPKLTETISYQLALDHVKDMLGGDMELDFDMLINKAPHTNTPTPWHQDAAYWIKMPDKRSASCWISLDEVYEENGCMWFIPKDADTILPHKHYTEGGALHCETDGKNAECIPLKPGGCTFHDGFTLHFSKGNTTDSHRRALILNFRPKAMIQLEREQGVDHTGERKVRNK
ncbi:phytanoyl-CoA dioxygenase family protein [Flagellimonas flava]|uniref:phytanoyl-CoA dioxygenase family protein n=1 Tax=Flagellimonas flava TaxID=570519 RepID=UPI003D64E426